MKKILISLMLFGVNLSAFAQQKDDTHTPKIITLATYQYGENNRLKNISPLASYLGNKTGYQVLIKSYPTVFEFINAINELKVDIALISTFGYFLLDTGAISETMEAVAALEISGDHKDNYKTAFVVPGDSKLSSFDAILRSAKNINLMLVAPGSTSGNLVPRLRLNGIGINDLEKQFQSVSYGGTHSRTIEAIGNGRADLGAMGSVDYFAYIAKSENKGRVRLISMSTEIPLGPVLLKKTLSKNLQNEITNAFLNLHQFDEEAFRAIKDGWSEAKQADCYIAVKPAYYLPFKSTLGKPIDLKRVLEQFAN